MTAGVASGTRPVPRTARQWRRLVKGRTLDTAMRIPQAIQPRRLRQRMHWTVRIGRARTPWDAQAATATSAVILTRADVTDLHAAFVADPFLLRHDGRWLLFVEVQDRLTMQGCIGLATSTDATRWSWQGVVLREPFHLSYPCVFIHDDTLFMVPESTASGAVRLYRAVDGPTRWRHVDDLVRGPALADATPVHHDDHWYLFVETSSGATHDELRLFHAARLRGPWVEHPSSPLVDGDPAIARPAGRPLSVDGRLYRLAQNCTTDYGVGVVAREITRLTPDGYDESPTTLPVLAKGGQGWRRNGMHHLSAQRVAAGDWLIATDGW